MNPSFLSIGALAWQLAAQSASAEALDAKMDHYRQQIETPQTPSEKAA